MNTIVHQPNFDVWRQHARAVMGQHIAPHAVHFQSTDEAQSHLFGTNPASDKAAAHQLASAPTKPSVRLPPTFIRDAQSVAAHSDPQRWDLLYRIIWRLCHGEPQLLQVSTDEDMLYFGRLHQAVKREVHHCHAFVRFVALTDATAPQGEHLVAWYKPQFAILPLAAPHFQARLGQMAWSILTPDASLTHRDGQMLWGPGCPRDEAPNADALESLWRVYYVNIFNPARLNRRAMMQEMPKRYWQNMPETTMIDELVKSAPKQTQLFLQSQPPKAPPKPEHEDLTSHNVAASQCGLCPWSAQSTQTVLGEGAPKARIMFVGEQPGDQEDRVGRPFVGPAGQLLDEALTQAGIDRADLYVTNAVKHFKWTPQGKRRLHQKPNAQDVAACRPWLLSEIRLVAPEWLVCLGTTAALAAFGKAVRLKDVRGQLHQTPACAQTFCTTHPSAILRTPPEAKKAAFDAFVADLRKLAEHVGSSPRAKDS